MKSVWKVVSFLSFSLCVCAHACRSQGGRHVWFTHLEVISVPEALAHRGLIWWKAGGAWQWSDTGREEERGSPERDRHWKGVEAPEGRGRAWEAPRFPLISGMERKRSWRCLLSVRSPSSLQHLLLLRTMLLQIPSTPQEFWARKCQIIKQS